MSLIRACLGVTAESAAKAVATKTVSMANMYTLNAFVLCALAFGSALDLYISECMVLH
jgi:hypothetical protein